MLYNENSKGSKNEASNEKTKEQINKVIKQLNAIEQQNTKVRTSPIRSHNSSVLGKSKKPVNIK